MTDYTWDGGGADNNWSTTANWSTDDGTYPDDNGDKAIFNNTDISSVSMDVAITVGEINIQSGYTGTITQTGTTTIDDAGTETGNLTVADSSATWDAGGNALTVDGDVDITGTIDCHTNGDPAVSFGNLIVQSSGTYEATSETTTISDFLINHGTLTNNGGTINGDVLLNANTNLNGNWDVSGKLFAGAGTLDTVNNNITANNLTIPTGGTLDGQSNTVNVSGDWKSSGGLIGKSALDLDGSSQYVEVSDDASLDMSGGNSITIMAWINANSFDGKILEKYNSGRGYELMFHYPQLRFAHAGGGSNSPDNLDTTTGVWTYIGATYNGSTIEFWQDGKSLGTVSSNGGIDDTSDNLFIGMDGDDINHFKGQIARVSVWNTALTQSQIRELMFYDYDDMDNSGNFTTANCKGWWQMDGGSGTNVTDSTANANDGTASDSGVWAARGTFTENKSKIRHTGVGEIDLNHRDLSFYDLETNPNTTINTESDTILWIKNNAANLNEAKIKRGKGHIHTGKENPPSDYSIPQTIPIPLKK